MGAVAENGSDERSEDRSLGRLRRRRVLRRGTSPRPFRRNARGWRDGRRGGWQSPEEARDGGPRRDWSKPGGRGTGGSRRSTTRSNGWRADATIGVWNALETGKRRPEIPRLAARSSAWRTACAGPAITVCLGPFQLATRTSGTSRIEPIDIGTPGPEGRHRTGLA